MAFIERLLPRNWDARRLMSFLAGLALIALSFTAGTQPAQAAPASAGTSDHAASVTGTDRALTDSSTTEPVAITDDAAVLPAGRGGMSGTTAAAPSAAGPADLVAAPVTAVADRGTVPAAFFGVSVSALFAAEAGLRSAVVRGDAKVPADAECEHDASPRGPPLA